MDSPKKLDKNVPFQMSTRSNSDASIVETPKEVKVVLKKISPSALTPLKSTIKKNSASTKSTSKTESFDPISPSVNVKKTLLSGRAKILKKSIQSSDATSVPGIEAVDLTNTSPLSEKATSSSSDIQPSLAGKKRKNNESSSSSKTQVKKPKLPVTKGINRKAIKSVNKKGAGAVNKKAKSVLRKAVSVSAKRKVKTKVKTKEARTSPVKKNAASKKCSGCGKKEDNISNLQNKITELEKNQGSLQNRLTIYEGLGLSHFQREEENKTLLKKRLTLQQKLGKLQEDLQVFREREEAEVQNLLKKRETLKKRLEIAKKENIRLVAEEEEELKKLRSRNEDFEVNEAKNKIELDALKTEYYDLFEKVGERPKLYFFTQKEEPPEPPEPLLPCEICAELIERKRALKKECKELEKVKPALQKEQLECIEKMYVGASEVKYMQWEIEYLKDRLLIELRYKYGDDKDQACCDDLFKRREFAQKVGHLMVKQYTGKRYPFQPRCTAPLPRSKLEQMQIDACEEQQTKICCTYLSDECCFFLCDRLKSKKAPMTKEERIKYETSTDLLPCHIQTEEGKEYYFKGLAYCHSLTYEVDKHFKPEENPLRNRTKKIYIMEN